MINLGNQFQDQFLVLFYLFSHKSHEGLVRFFASRTLHNQWDTVNQQDSRVLSILF